MRITFDTLKNERISRDDLYISMAYLMAQRSQCVRKQVGAIITLQHRIISTGYNGSLKPLPCSIACNPLEKCYHAVHAEANAIAFAAGNGVKVYGATLYCTSSPCMECAKLIVQSGIYRVVYSDEYRLKDGILLLKENDIIVEQNNHVKIKAENSKEQEGPLGPHFPL
jgi:dCMP deaminase